MKRKVKKRNTDQKERKENMRNVIIFIIVTNDKFNDREIKKEREREREREREKDKKKKV